MIKQKTKPLLFFNSQGYPGPKGDRGDSGIPGLQVSTPLLFVVFDQEM